MQSGASEAAFTLSIDLELDLEQQTEASRQRLDDIRTELIALLEHHKLPATWAVADPAVSAATEPILASSIEHEIAVLADRSWFGPGAGRMRLRRELSRRFERARRAGIPVSTLVLRNVQEITEIDLLMEQGVTAIRGAAVDAWDAANPLRSLSRADIWHLPVAWQFPAQAPWWLPTNWSLKRRIRQRLRQQGSVHLAIDTPQLVDGDPNALESLSQLLSWVAALRDVGDLHVATMSALGKAFLQQHVAVPSRSILRPAA